MATFLLTWNPMKWEWDTLDDDLETYRTQGLWSTSWSCGRRKAIQAGDRVFLLKQGPQQPRGVFASGTVKSGANVGRNFSDPQKTAMYVEVAFDVLLDPRSDVFPRERLDETPLSSVNWSTQSAGILIPDDVAAILEKAWVDHVRRFGLNPVNPEYETGKTVTVYVEGRKQTVAITRLERSASARKACIDAKGTRCTVCDFDFGERYGSIGQGFIHVHHQDPLSATQRARQTDPIEDLVPVCPNCHAMLHSSNPPLTVSELRRQLRC
jgi:5-methylcytosine-specific restriction protein A